MSSNFGPEHILLATVLVSEEATSVSSSVLTTRILSAYTSHEANERIFSGSRQRFVEATCEPISPASLSHRTSFERLLLESFDGFRSSNKGKSVNDDTRTQRNLLALLQEIITVDHVCVLYSKLTERTQERTQQDSPSVVNKVNKNHPLYRRLQLLFKKSTYQDLCDAVDELQKSVLRVTEELKNVTNIDIYKVNNADNVNQLNYYTDPSSSLFLRLLLFQKLKFYRHFGSGLRNFYDSLSIIGGSGTIASKQGPHLVSLSLAVQLFAQNKTTQAFYHLEEAIRSAQELGDVVALCYCLYHLGSYYLGSYDSANQASGKRKTKTPQRTPHLLNTTTQQQQLLLHLAIERGQALGLTELQCLAYLQLARATIRNTTVNGRNDKVTQSQRMHSLLLLAEQQRFNSTSLSGGNGMNAPISSSCCSNPSLRQEILRTKWNLMRESGQMGIKDIVSRITKTKSMLSSNRKTDQSITKTNLPMNHDEDPLVDSSSNSRSSANRDHTMKMKTKPTLLSLDSFIVPHSLTEPTSSSTTTTCSRPVKEKDSATDSFVAVRAELEKGHPVTALEMLCSNQNSTNPIDDTDLYSLERLNLKSRCLLEIGNMENIDSSTKLSSSTKVFSSTKTSSTTMPKKLLIKPSILQDACGYLEHCVAGLEKLLSDGNLAGTNPDEGRAQTLLRESCYLAARCYHEIGDFTKRNHFAQAYKNISIIMSSC